MAAFYESEAEKEALDKAYDKILKEQKGLKKHFLDSFPYDSTGAVIILSGGMDSTTAMRLAVEKFGKDNVHALSFYYQQKQSIELWMAQQTTTLLRVKHKLINMEFYGDICKGVTSNVDKSMPTPSVQDVLGDPHPTTVVPYRNLIMLSIAASYAESNNLNTIMIGTHQEDIYSYWDTTKQFIDALNAVIKQNRKFKPTIYGPFVGSTKTDEIKLLIELDGNADLLKYTFACYDPDNRNRSCGKCSACSQRIRAFKNCGLKDTLEYSKEIKWTGTTSTTTIPTNAQ